MRFPRAGLTPALALAALATLAAQAPVPVGLPVGTAIPIQFSHALEARKLKAGDAVAARTTERIAANGISIPAGAEVLGGVVGVQAGEGGGETLTLRFDRLHFGAQQIPLHAGVRALASFTESYGVHYAAMSNDESAVSLYRQIGGDYYYPQSVVYSATGAAVGSDTRDGIRVKLLSTLPTNANDVMVCDANDQPQAVGVFSSGACGVYGFSDLTVTQEFAPGAPPTIQIRSHAKALKLGAWSVMLLEVVADRP